MSSSSDVPPVIPPPKPEAGIGMPTEDERTWALIAHLSGLAGYLVGGLTFIPPLVIWLIKKDESAFVGDQAKEALNFQIAVTIAAVVSIAATFATCGMLVPLVVIVGIGSLIYQILGAIEAQKGNLYRYPYTIRLIK